MRVCVYHPSQLLSQEPNYTLFRYFIGCVYLYVLEEDLYPGLPVVLAVRHQVDPAPLKQLKRVFGLYCWGNKFKRPAKSFAFPRVVFVLIMNYNLFHMLGHLTTSANGQLYTIKINKDFLPRLLIRGVLQV